MAADDNRCHVEVSDGERTVAAAEVRRLEPERTARVSLHAESGHIPVGSRASLVDAVLAQPEVRNSARLEATIPMGDGESLTRLRQKCEDVRIRPAGVSLLVDASLPPQAHRAAPRGQDAATPGPHG